MRRSTDEPGWPENFDGDASPFVDDTPTVDFEAVAGRIVRDMRFARWILRHGRSIGIVLLGLCVALGFLIGRNSVTVPQPVVHTVTVTKTHEVKIPGPATTVISIPEACQYALQQLADMKTRTFAVIDFGENAQQALQDAYLAIASKDYKAINKASTKIRQLQDSLTAPGSRYLETYTDVSSSVNSCLDQLNHR